MRRIAVIAMAALAAALACAGCGAVAGQAPGTTRPLAAQSGPTASTTTCYAFAVSALRQRVIVRRMPPECAGLGAEQVDLAISRAIRTVAGPLPKAEARRKDLAESPYLALLIRQAGAPSPASLAAGPAVAADTLVPRLAALAAWLAAALAGAYLLTGGRRPRSLRQLRGLGLAGGHASVAATGLCLWVAYMATSARALGWIDVVLTWVIAGLGMATLLGGGPANPAGPVLAPAVAAADSTAAGAPAAARAPVPAAAVAAADWTAAAAPARARAPVLVIALHGAFAATTILLVLLAVTGAS
jgi:manganese efflux pump family protein